LGQKLGGLVSLSFCLALQAKDSYLCKPISISRGSHSWLPEREPG